MPTTAALQFRSRGLTPAKLREKTTTKKKRGSLVRRQLRKRSAQLKEVLSELGELIPRFGKKAKDKDANSSLSSIPEL